MVKQFIPFLMLLLQVLSAFCQSDNQINIYNEDFELIGTAGCQQNFDSTILELSHNYSDHYLLLQMKNDMAIDSSSISSDYAPYSPYPAANPLKPIPQLIADLPDGYYVALLNSKRGYIPIWEKTIFEGKFDGFVINYENGIPSSITTYREGFRKNIGIDFPRCTDEVSRLGVTDERDIERLIQWVDTLFINTIIIK